MFIYIYEEVRHDIHNSQSSNIASSALLFGGHDLGDSHKGVIRIFQVVENDPKSSIYGVILRMRKRTLNRAYAPISSHPDSEDLFGIKLLYDIIIFFLCGCLGWTGTLFFVCVFFQLSTQDTLVGQRYYDEKIIIEG